MPNKGYRHTPEALAKMSAVHKGRPLSPEARAARIGRRNSDEARAKISAALKGRPKSATHREAIRIATTGHVPSPEARAHQSAALSGRTLSAEVRARMSGWHHTPEVRETLRSSRLNPVILGECVYCFGPASGQDHVIPRGRPGWNDPANVVLACQPCNASKGNRTPDEWLDVILARAH